MTAVRKGSHLTCSRFDLLTALTVILRHIQAFVNAARNGLYLSAQLLLNALQVKAVIIGDQINGQTQVSKTT